MGEAGVEKIVPVSLSVFNAQERRKEIETHDLWGGFSGTISTVPLSCMKYMAGLQYADMSCATPQLVQLDSSRSSAVAVVLKAA